MEIHVFLSFREEDTRLGFTGHLYEALQKKSIITFRDDDELARGEEISTKVLQAIELWCFDELQKIVETNKRLGQHVFPVFYGVDPSHIRHQKGSFAENFRNHEAKFVENKEKVQKWRDALKDIANIAGWDAKNKHEMKLIEEIVAEVWKKIEPKLPTYNDGLVAIDTKVDEMYSHLRPELEDVRFIGIWGMGGIGRTTLATVVFKRIQSQFNFDVSCFLANVGEASKEGDQGLVHLQNKLLSHMKLKSIMIENLGQGKDKIRNFLYKKKVLLVLDDVNAESQLENLSGNQDWFGSGSRIIVTTREKHLLISHGELFEMYKMKNWNTDESLHLFCEKAFKGCQPREDYLKLSKDVVEDAGGLPLALKVIGSFLCGRSVHEWKDELIKIRKIHIMIYYKQT